MVLNRNGKLNNSSFDWYDAIIDALIMTGSTFFLTIGAIGAVGLLDDPKTGILTAAIAAAGQFFFILALKRNLVDDGTN